MLITSRETRRWVIPKGNPMRSLAPYAAAMVEAEEEAGVRGAVCPTPIGSYRYWKRRRNGASDLLDVDVFPLAVKEELGQWKESRERERRWFTPTDAADAVEEPDLAELIRLFDPCKLGEALQGAGEPTSMLASVRAWFRRWLF